MRKKYILLALATTTILFTLSLSARKAGSPGGATGSPLDGASCGNSSCHNTATQLDENKVSITSNIPSSGYIAGNTYDITVNATDASSNRYGFELSALNGSNTSKLGLFTAGNTETKVLTSGVGNGNATHTNTGIDGTGGKSWTVQWQAPNTGAGDVHFWAAALIGNGNGNAAGDQVYRDSLTVIENNSTSVFGIEKLKTSFKSYPNPVVDFTTVSFETSGALNAKLALYNAEGKLLTVLENRNFVKGLYTLNIDLSNFQTGLYYLRLESDQFAVTNQLIKI